MQARHFGPPHRVAASWFICRCTFPIWEKREVWSMARPERTLSVVAVVPHTAAALFIACRRVDFKAKQLFSKPGQLCIEQCFDYSSVSTKRWKMWQVWSAESNCHWCGHGGSFLLAFLKVFWGSVCWNSPVFSDYNRNIPLKPQPPLHPASHLAQVLSVSHTVVSSKDRSGKLKYEAMRNGCAKSSRRKHFPIAEH